MGLEFMWSKTTLEMLCGLTTTTNHFGAANIADRAIHVGFGEETSKDEKKHLKGWPVPQQTAGGQNEHPGLMNAGMEELPSTIVTWATLVTNVNRASKALQVTDTQFDTIPPYASDS